MGLAKTVAGEAHDHRPDLVDGGGGSAVVFGAEAKLMIVVPQLPVFMFLADDLSELIRILEGKIGERHGHLRDVFLIDHDAMGLFQNGFEQRMQRDMRLSMRAPDEVVHKGNCGWPDQRRPRNRMTEAVSRGETVGRRAAPELSEQEPGGRRFDVKTTDGVATSDEVLRG